MDLITNRHLFQKEVDHISNHIWEIVKCIGDSLEVEDDDFENDIFYTPPNSPFEPIFAQLEEHLVVNRGRRRSCIFWDKHMQICYQVLYLQLVGHVVHLE
jgi:hypothetical protein